MYKFFVALRYMRRNWLNLVGSLAVAIGVMVLICVLSVMKGFDEEFRARIRATLSDLIVETWGNQPFGEYEQMVAKIEKLPHVEACAPQFDGLGLVSIDEQPRYCEFHGIDLERELATTDLAEYWRTWRGREAKDELSLIFAGSAAAPPDPSPETVRTVLQRIRPSDFDDLPPATTSIIRDWAAKHGVALQDEFAVALKAVPVWGSVTDPRVSPVLVGGEMLVIGKDIYGQLVRLETGKQVVLITLPAQRNMNVEKRNLARGQIAGAFHSGMYEYDSQNLYLPLADAQRIMEAPGEITSISIRLDSFANAPEVRARILGILTPDEIQQGINALQPHLAKSGSADLENVRQQLEALRAQIGEWFATGNPRAVHATREIERRLLELSSAVLRSNPAAAKDLQSINQLILSRETEAVGSAFRVSTWEDKRRTFLRAVWLERRIMGYILFFVILIAGFLVLSILHTTVLNKTRDIGILKSIGGSVRGIMGVFMLNGFLIGLIGAASGAAAGLFITNKINEIEAVLTRLTGFKLFPADIYYFDRIPVDKHPTLSAALISVTALLISLLASAYPAWKASRMNAVEALRYE